MSGWRDLSGMPYDPRVALHSKAISGVQAVRVTGFDEFRAADMRPLIEDERVLSAELHFPAMELRVSVSVAERPPAPAVGTPAGAPRAAPALEPDDSSVTLGAKRKREACETWIDRLLEKVESEDREALRGVLRVTDAIEPVSSEQLRAHLRVRRSFYVVQIRGIKSVRADVLARLDATVHMRSGAIAVEIARACPSNNLAF